MSPSLLGHMEGLDDDEQAQLLVTKFAKVLLSTVQSIEGDKDQPSVPFESQEPSSAPVASNQEYTPVTGATSEAEEIENPNAEVESVEDEDVTVEPVYKPA